MSGWQPLNGDEPAPPKAEGSAGNKAIIIVAVGTVGCLFLVAIVGILAAIAIPNFLAYQLRAKRAEAPSVLDGIRTAELAYVAEFGQVVELGPCPAAPPQRDLRPWDGNCLEQLEQLGYVPSSLVRCSFEVRQVAASEEGGPPEFTAAAFCDGDGDGDEASYSAGSHERSQMVTPINVF